MKTQYYWCLDPESLTNHLIKGVLIYGEPVQTALCGFKPTTFWYPRSDCDTTDCKDCAAKHCHEQLIT